MREIIFRGKRIGANGKWVYGDLLQFQDHAVIHQYEYGCRVAYEIDPATVGQYTGLKDRNGVQIFEGDVFQCKDARGYVRFGTYSSAYSSGDTHIGFYIEWIVDRMLRIDLAFWTNQREIEVIGNIHNHPELLEEHHE